MTNRVGPLQAAWSLCLVVQSAILLSITPGRAEKRSAYNSSNNYSAKHQSSVDLSVLPRTLGKQMEALVDLRETRTANGQPYVYDARGLINRMNAYWTNAAPKGHFEVVAWEKYLSGFYYSLKNYREQTKKDERTNPDEEKAIHDFLDLVGIRTTAEYLRHVVRREQNRAGGAVFEVPEDMPDKLEVLLGRLRNRTLLAPGVSNPSPEASPSRKQDEAAFLDAIRAEWKPLLAAAHQIAGETIGQRLVERNGRLQKEFTVYRDNQYVPNGVRHPFTPIVIKHIALDPKTPDTNWDKAFLQLVVDEGLRINAENKTLSYLLSQLDQRLRWGDDPFMVKPTTGPFESVEKLTGERQADDPIANEAIKSLRSFDLMWSNYNRSIVRGYWGQLLDEFVTAGQTYPITVPSVRLFIRDTLGLLPDPPLEKSKFLTELISKRLDFGH